MASSQGLFSISLVSILEEVLKEQGKRLSDLDLASRKADEAAARRYEAAGWLRRTVGFAEANDFPQEPTEEDFRLGLRSGFILCIALNNVHPGAVTKVVVSSADSVIKQDAAALSAYQYFENVRNFLVAVEELGLPTFEASDFEQGGKSSRIINCILALKSYSEWKIMGGTGSWKFGANTRPAVSGKKFMRKNSDPFSNSLSRSRPQTGKDNLSAESKLNVESHEMTPSFSNLVRAVLSNKQPEDAPMLVESILSKVIDEFEHHIARQNEEKNDDIKITMSKEESFHKNHENEEASKDKLLKQCLIIDQQQRHIHELRGSLQSTRSHMKLMQTKCSEEIQHIRKHVCNLANVASGYHKVFEENRKLYNEVQDLKGSIRVYCRVRPNLPGKFNSCTIGCFDDKTITINAPSKCGKDGRRTFTFNKVFGPLASQEEIFSDTQPLVRSVLDGYNVCIFAYGQTGSGKTYTMTGPQELNQHNMGVNYRALRDLFNLAKQRSGTFIYEISLQMIEIYNEQVRDLLISDGSNKRLDIRNGSQKGVNVPEANLFPVSSTADVIELMNIGQRNRVVGATALNDRSSRSHSCLTIHVQGKDLTSGSILHGCMHLVDLAGSERVDKSEVTGERLREAKHINKSLSALGDVISALAHKSSHIPYRNSKLTQLLQDSLGGQAKTLMFVHISPEMDAIGETISTLKFAERVSSIELGAAQINKDSAEMKELKMEIAKLKATISTRGEDSDHLQSMTPTINALKMKTMSTSPAYTNIRHQEDVSSYQSSSHRQPMEKVCNVEVQGNSGSKQNKRSFDLQELLMTEDSHVWTDSSPLNSHQENDRGFSCGNWVDKAVVNKHVGPIADDWVEEEADLPDSLYQKYASDSTLFQVQQNTRGGNLRKNNNDFEVHRHRFDPAITDNSDDLDVATSDSSEADALWQINVPKAVYTNNNDESKIRKPLVKSVNNPNPRTPTQGNIPSPSRKILSGSDRTISKQPSFGRMDGKRTASVGKIRGGK